MNLPKTSTSFDENGPGGLRLSASYAYLYEPYNFAPICWTSSTTVAGASYWFGWTTFLYQGFSRLANPRPLRMARPLRLVGSYGLPDLGSLDESGKVRR